LAAALIAALVVFAFWLRVHALSAEGFADDEVHKWLAANRYLHGGFGGDDVEHPMLMKWLIALCIAAFPRSWAPETLTRLPNALVGAATVWLTAQFGKRVFGRFAGALAAALAAVSPTLIGYQRVAKEDTLVGAFLLLMLWFIAEAAGSRERRRWEGGIALALAGMLASKYYVFFAPLPVLAWASLHSETGSGDDRAHEGDRAAYLATLRRYDAWLEELLGAVDAETVVIVTTDHGRSASNWRKHGAAFPGSRDIWLWSRGLTAPVKNWTGQRKSTGDGQRVRRR
jgi:predicted membrane-bound mannosyltransferase